MTHRRKSETVKSRPLPGVGPETPSPKLARGDRPPARNARGRSRALPAHPVTQTPVRRGGSPAAWTADPRLSPAGGSPGAGRRGQRQALGLLERSVLAGFCREGTAPLTDFTPHPAAPPRAQDLGGALDVRKNAPGAKAKSSSRPQRPSPRQACSWLVSTLRISLTHAALISGLGA